MTHKLSGHTRKIAGREIRINLCGRGSSCDDTELRGIVPLLLAVSEDIRTMRVVRSLGVRKDLYILRGGRKEGDCREGVHVVVREESE